MIVYTATIIHGSYEGESLISVHETQEGAQEACLKYDRRRAPQFVSSMEWRPTFFEDDEIEEESPSLYTDAWSGVFRVTKTEVQP